MKDSITTLTRHLEEGTDYLRNLPVNELILRPAPGKWSKIEILGHLIDSAINNLQRFTEIQFKPTPFTFNNYDQDDLVVANNYQDADLEELLILWRSLNQRIIRLMENQTEERLAYEIQVTGGDNYDLRFLMEDYVSHLVHHLRQIMR